MSTCMPTLQEQFGAIDIYLFDQLLRGNVSKGMTIFDAGCGTGRNIVYLLREGYEVWSIAVTASSIRRRSRSAGDRRRAPPRAALAG